MKPNYIRTTSIAAYTAVLLMLVLSSCSGDPETKKPRVFEGYGLWMDTVMKSPDKIIRGFEIGDNMEAIKKAEGIAPVEEDSCSLYYELFVDSSTNVTLTYSFLESKLSEVEMSIHSKTDSSGMMVLGDLKKYFDSRYPGSVSEKGLTVYSTKTSSGRSVKISISDVSGVDNGHIDLLVYEDQ